MNNTVSLSSSPVHSFFCAGQPVTHTSPQGPTMEEWRLQPLPSQTTNDISDELAGFLELDGCGEEVTHGDGVEGSNLGGSFAAITRMGFAAALDSPSLVGDAQPVNRGPQGVWGAGSYPSLPGTSPPARSAAVPWGGSAPSVGGVWGGSGRAPGGAWAAGGPSSSSQSSSTSTQKKGSGKKPVLLFSSGGQRRY